MQSTKDERSYAALIHISSIVGALIFNVGNLLFPLLLWFIKKDESAFIDEVGKEVVNFQLSLMIYYFVGLIVGILTLGIGFILLIPLWIALSILTLIFALIGTVKALNGEIYRYPLNLRIIK